MLEFIVLILIFGVTSFILLMLTSIFMAYVTQARYLDDQDVDSYDD